MPMTFVLVGRTGTEVIRRTVHLMFVDCVGCHNVGPTMEPPEPLAQRHKYLENENFVSRRHEINRMLEGDSIGSMKKIR